ncbi:MAG: hypothetical protein KDD41_11205 [Flavobacteriales bacterium]|nr:hypothetical protein [Flavobacteriales bacterium]
MKTLAFLISTAFIFQISAQSLQDSFNTALTKSDLPEQQTPLYSLQANVDYTQHGVQLKWNITAENLSYKFIIEKSADKSIWIEVSTVYGAAHKQQDMEYFYVDFMPLENLSYYRIVQVTETGDESLSNTIPVNYVLTEYNTAGVSLFPISTDGEAFKISNIHWEEVFDHEILLVLRDKKGEEFYSKAVINIENEKIIAVPIEKQIPSGEYLITASSENQIYSQNITIN